MRKGIIIYAPEDIEKNRKFVSICTDIVRKNGMELHLVILEDKKQEKLQNYIETVRFKENASDKIKAETIKLEEVSFAINRSRNHYVAKHLESAGVRVFNNANITEIANDKWKTYRFVKNMGIDVMETWWSNNANECKIAYPRVVKSCDGHGGSEVFLVNSEDEEKKAVNEMSHPFIIQELADAKGRDIRVYIVGGEIVVAMCRSAKEGFKSNFTLGGSAEKYQLNKSEIDIVNKIVTELKPDYVGIDLIYDGGKVVLNEIEDAVGARMVYENTKISIIEMYAEYVVNSVLNI